MKTRENDGSPLEELNHDVFVRFPRFCIADTAAVRTIMKAPGLLLLPVGTVLADGIDVWVLFEKQVKNQTISKE